MSDDEQTFACTVEEIGVVQWPDVNWPGPERIFRVRTADHARYFIAHGLRFHQDALLREELIGLSGTIGLSHGVPVWLSLTALPWKDAKETR